VAGTPKPMTKVQVIKELRQLPDQVSPEFPAAIRSLVEQVPEPEAMFGQILNDQKMQHSVRFAALYSVLLRLRREERYNDYTELMRRNEKEFSAEPYFLTFEAVIARLRGADSSALRSAAEYSRRAARLMPDVAGVVHQLAAFLVEYNELIDNPVPRDVAEAEDNVERAIALSSGKLAHFFETKARVLALRGDFVGARAAIGEAIELEPRGGLDYSRRIAQYQTTRVRIDIMRERQRWMSSQEQFRSEIDRFRIQQLELLGLLAAVVAFVATAGNIASHTSGRDGVRLMLALSGSVILVFSSFSLMSTRSIWRVAIAALVGVLLLLLGSIAPGWAVR
jgi:hypothetical protein